MSEHTSPLLGQPATTTDARIGRVVEVLLDLVGVARAGRLVVVLEDAQVEQAAACWAGRVNRRETLSGCLDAARARRLTLSMSAGRG